MNIKKWQTYEEVTRYILNDLADELDLENVEGKQHVKGHISDTTYEIDAKGTTEGKAAFVIIECRRYTTSKIDQEQLGALAYRIKDAGAKGGIIVSPLGIQKGASKIAKSENIISVELSERATRENYFIRFLNKLFGKISDSIIVSDSASARVIPAKNNEIDE